MKKILLLSLSLLCMLFFVSCESKGDSSNSSEIINPDISEDNSIIEGDNAHYLTFYYEGNEIVRMLVNKDDTYESLKDYFPTLPENYVWDKIDNVYDEKNNEIIISAYYIAK